ncbi:MAG: DNA-3-methyladenine glycosylase 2 family protein [Saprospiraceae bacterium]
MIDIVNEEDIQQLTSKDETFKYIHDLYGVPPNWARPQGFISLSKIILEQQVSLVSANVHFIKLESYLPEFSPHEIMKLTDEEMRSCQISRQKSTYLRALSNAILEQRINLEQLEMMEHTEVRKKLISLKGIGEWTTDIYQMFCLQSKDIFPIGDIAVVNTVKELYTLPSREEILVLSERWKPYRSLASYYFWHHYLSKRKPAKSNK